MSNTPGKHRDGQLRKDLTFLAVATHDDCGGLVEAQYFHHAAWYLDLIAAGGKFKGKWSQSKPFSNKDVVDNNLGVSNRSMPVFVVLSGSDILRIIGFPCLT